MADQTETNSETQTERPTELLRLNEVGTLNHSRRIATNILDNPLAIRRPRRTSLQSSTEG
jgi:hypothetical protein